MAGRKHTGVVDTEKAQALKFFADAERDKQKVLEWIENEKAGEYLVCDDNPVHIREHQMGKPLHFEQFEKLIRKLPNGDNYVFLDSPVNNQFKLLKFKMPDGTLRSISPYGKALLPEYSTLVLKARIERDFSVNILNPRDMPAMVWDPVAKRHVSKNGSLLPGWRKVYHNEGEDPTDPQARGYRSILMRLPKMGLATPEEIEKAFGKSSRASWQSLHRDTGYRF